MHYVLLATHTPEICPTSNAKNREMMQNRASEIPALAKRLGVKLVAGPCLSHEHLGVIIVESAKAESVNQFVLESGLAQWNSVRIVPSITMEEGQRDMNALKTIF